MQTTTTEAGAPKGARYYDYGFDCTLSASIRVKARSKKEALAMLRANLDCASTNAGAWDIGPDAGEPILFEASLSGEPKLYEKEAV